MVQLSNAITYPDSDGKPMADNTEQFRYIVTIQGNLAALFLADPMVFVAGDLLWYPVEGNNRICQAPDTMVSFGRPKGKRGSYQQWKEAGIAPQVVFEVLSPSNTPTEMTKKFHFYARYGVDEYYIYDPDRGELDGYIRADGSLQAIETMEGWVSPRLGVRFTLATNGALVLYRPDGSRFLTFEELDLQARQALAAAEAADQRAEAADQRAEAADQRAEAADQRAAQEQARADVAQANLARLTERMRELGLNPTG